MNILRSGTAQISRWGVLLVAGITLFAAPIATQRMAPPAGLPCSRDELTSYTGRIVRYQRQPQLISITVRTDEATTEHFKIKLIKGQSLLALFLLDGAPITAEALKKVEKDIAKNPRRMRVTVWECLNSKQRVIHFYSTVK